MKNGKVITFFVAICFLFSICFVSAYKYNNEKIEFIGNKTKYESGEKIYSYYIDEISYDNRYCKIVGWAAKIGENLDYVDRKYVLIDSVGDMYAMNTVKVYRESVTDYYNDGYSYNNAGLQGAFNLNSILNEKYYDVGILISEKSGKEYLIITDNFIENNGV